MEVAAQPVDGNVDGRVVERDFAVEAFGEGVPGRVANVLLLAASELDRGIVDIREGVADDHDGGDRVPRAPEEERRLRADLAIERVEARRLAGMKKLGCRPDLLRGRDRPRSPAAHQLGEELGRGIPGGVRGSGAAHRKHAGSDHQRAGGLARRSVEPVISADASLRVEAVDEPRDLRRGVLDVVKSRAEDPFSLLLLQVELEVAGWEIVEPQNQPGLVRAVAGGGVGAPENEDRESRDQYRDRGKRDPSPVSCLRLPHLSKSLCPGAAAR